MGTRAITTVEEGGKEILCLYRQMDGYPTGHGKELQDLFGELTVVNGISGAEELRTHANGMGCFAAQLVSELKDSLGSIYVEPPGTRDMGEEWLYTLHLPEDSKQLHIRVQAGCVTFFGLPGTKQENMPVFYDGPLALMDVEAIEKHYDENLDQIRNDYLEARKAEEEAAKVVNINEAKGK